MTNGEIDAYCLDWQAWCKSRGFYIRPGAKNILARNMPSKVGQPPNARNSAQMQFFNMALHMLGDMEENAGAVECFNFYYPIDGTERAENIKQIADKMGIHRVTYYKRVLAFSRKAFHMAHTLRAVHSGDISTEKLPKMHCSVTDATK